MLRTICFSRFSSSPSADRAWQIRFRNRNAGSVTHRSFSNCTSQKLFDYKAFATKHKPFNIIKNHVLTGDDSFDVVVIGGGKTSKKL